MKICLVIYQFNELRGGAERACSYLARGLAERGHDVYVYSHKFKQYTSIKLTHRFVDAGGLLSLSHHLSFAANAKKLLQRERFDIIHSFSRTYFQDILRVGGGIHRFYLKNMPSNLWDKITGIFKLKERAIISLEKKCFQNGAYKKIIAVSQKTKQEIIDAYPEVKPEDIVVIYNGVDLTRFHPANKTYARSKIRSMFGISDKTFLLLFVGTGFKRKGLRNAIEAVSLLPKSTDIILFVIGKGNIPYYRNVARAAHIPEKVFFLGTRDNIHEFYAAADALILPTYYDPFPNVCLEALASGLPVITTKNAGISEILTHEKNALIIENPDLIVDITEHIKKLFEPDVRKDISQKARILAENFSIERNVEENLRLYNEVLKSKSAT